MRALPTFVFLGFAYLSVADEPRKDQYCVNAIYTAYAKLTFTGNPLIDQWNSTCQNFLKLTSTYASVKIYCTEHETQSGIEFLASQCMQHGDINLLPMSRFAENLTADAIGRMRVVEYGEIAAKTKITTPVLMSAKYYAASFRTVDIWEFESWSHHTYGFAMYGFWGAILVMAMVNNAYNTFWHRRANRSAPDVEGSQATCRSARHSLIVQIHHWVKTNIIIPPVFGRKCRQLFYTFSIPTRMIAIIIGMFWSLSFILCAVNIRMFEGNLRWAKIPTQVWKYVADRTGIMCISNLPLIWMFSGRNNIFLWATGWDFATFNVFHRNIARVATLEAIVHAISYTHLFRSQGNYQAKLSASWFVLGITAVVSMSSLLIFSSIWLRKRFYEIFLLMHIALSVTVIVSLFYHTSIFKGAYKPYLWPLVAIWVFDRFLRIVRQIYCNVRIKFSGKMITTSTSTTTYDQYSDVIKITVKPANAFLKPGPGQFFYIYSPLAWRGWENHPFTLGSCARPGQVVPHRLPSLAMNKNIAVTEKDIIESPKTSRLNSFADEEMQASGVQNLIFWLRPFDGWTKGLRDKCLSNEGVIVHSRMMIEGPYGHATHLHNYEHVILIAGGTGISAIVPYVEEHIHRATSSRADGSTSAETSLQTREIEMIWTCRRAAFIHDVASKELRPVLARSDVRTSFFSTSAAQSTSISVTTGDAEFSGESASLAVDIAEGRPDITGTILQAARNHVAAGSQAGRLAVLVCGPAGMADDCRSAVHMAMKDGCTSIEYIEETFGW